MEMRLSMKIGKRIFFYRPGRLFTFLRFKLPPRAEVCGGENLFFRPGRNLAVGKKHVSARGGSFLLFHFDLPLGADGCFELILPFRPRRRDV